MSPGTVTFEIEKDPNIDHPGWILYLFEGSKAWQARYYTRAQSRAAVKRWPHNFRDFDRLCVPDPDSGTRIAKPEDIWRLTGPARIGWERHMAREKARLSKLNRAA